MSDISWALYAINLVANFQAALGIVVTALIFYILFVTIINLVEQEQYDYKKRSIRWATLSLVAATTVLCLMPSTQTIYMMIASEVGQQILALETVQTFGHDLGDLTSETINLILENIKQK